MGQEDTAGDRQGEAGEALTRTHHVQRGSDAFCGLLKSRLNYTNEPTLATWLARSVANVSYGVAG